MDFAGYIINIKVMSCMLLFTFDYIYGINEQKMEIFRHHAVWPDKVKFKLIDREGMCVK